MADYQEWQIHRAVFWYGFNVGMRERVAAFDFNGDGAGDYILAQYEKRCKNAQKRLKRTGVFQNTECTLLKDEYNEAYAAGLEGGKMPAQCIKSKSEW